MTENNQKKGHRFGKEQSRTGTTRKNEAGVDFVMSFKKKKKCLNDFIFSGTVGCECTEETYALVKSWLPESVRMPKVKF